MLKKYFLVLSVLLSLSTMANDSADEAATAVGPCKQDVATLCPGIEPGKGAIKECLKKNQDKLSAECKDKFAAKKEEVKGKMKDIEETCKAEVEKYCADVKKGKGKIVKCLIEKKDEEGFAAECKEAVEALKGKKFKNFKK